MFEKISKIYILLTLIIFPILTLYSLFGLLPFFPLNFIIMGLGGTILVCMMFFSFTKRTTYISLIDGLICISFIWFFFIIFINGYLHSYTEDGRYISAIRYYVPFFIVSLCCYFIFKKGAFFFIGNEILYALLLMYAGLSIITVLYFNPREFKIDFSQLIDSSFIGVYQIVSDSLAFTVICFLSLASVSKVCKAFVVFATLFFLLILNARSGLIGFILALCFIFNIRRFIIEHPLSSVLLTLVVIGAFSLLFPDLYSVASFFESSNERIYSIFSGNFGADASFLGRMKLLFHSLSVISEHPILGDFGSQASGDIDGFGIRWGAYTHNILVYWDQFGLIGFLCVLIIIVIIYNNNRQLKRHLGINLMPLIVLVLSQQLFLKSFTYFYLFALAGLIEGVKNANKYNYNDKKFL